MEKKFYSEIKKLPGSFEWVIRIIFRDKSMGAAYLISLFLVVLYLTTIIANLPEFKNTFFIIMQASIALAGVAFFVELLGLSEEYPDSNRKETAMTEWALFFSSKAFLYAAFFALVCSLFISIKQSWIQFHILNIPFQNWIGGVLYLLCGLMFLTGFFTLVSIVSDLTDSLREEMWQK